MTASALKPTIQNGIVFVRAQFIVHHARCHRWGAVLFLRSASGKKTVNFIVGKREFATFQSIVGYFVSLGRSAESEFVRCRDLQSERISTIAAIFLFPSVICKLAY